MGVALALVSRAQHRGGLAQLAISPSPPTSAHAAVLGLLVLTPLFASAAPMKSWSVLAPLMWGAFFRVPKKRMSVGAKRVREDAAPGGGFLAHASFRDLVLHFFRDVADEQGGFGVYLEKGTLSERELRAHAMKSLLERGDGSCELILRSDPVSHLKFARRDFRPQMILKPVVDTFVVNFIKLHRQLKAHAFKGFTDLTLNMAFLTSLCRQPELQTQLAENYTKSVLSTLLKRADFGMNVHIVVFSGHAIQLACESLSPSSHVLTRKLSIRIMAVRNSGEAPIVDVSNFSNVKELAINAVLRGSFGDVPYRFPISLAGESETLSRLEGAGVMIIPRPGLDLPNLTYARVDVASAEHSLAFEKAVQFEGADRDQRDLHISVQPVAA